MSRTVLVKIRATEIERQRWREKAEAAGLSLSDLVRQSLGRVRTWTAQDREAADARTRELAKLGNNHRQGPKSRLKGDGGHRCRPPRGKARSAALRRF